MRIPPAILAAFQPGNRRLALGLVYLVVLALAGGASRGDEFAQILVRLAALSVIAILLIAPVRRPTRSVVPPMVVLGLAALLIGLQLVPLPPGVWHLLPGRAPVARADAFVGIGDQWRTWTLSPDRSWNALLSLLVPAATLAVLARMTLRERAAMLPAILLLIAFSLLLMLLQLAIGGEWVIYTPNSAQAPSGLFTNRNHQALLLAMSIPLLACWAVDQRRSRLSPTLRFWIAVGGLATLLIFLPATGSRAGLILGALALLLSVPLVWGQIADRLAQMRRRMRRRILAGGATAFMAVLVVAVAFSRAVSVQRLLQLSIADDTRRRLFPRVVEMAQTYFPVGSGFGSFDPAFRRFERLSDLQTTYFNQAHNDLAQIVIEGGLPALILTVVAIAILSWRSVEVWRAPAERSAVRLARAASICLVLVVAASVADYPLRTPLHMALLALLSVWLMDRPTASDSAEPTTTLTSFTVPGNRDIGDGPRPSR